jgi:ABC-2 type transport system permease protein
VKHAVVGRINELGAAVPFDMKTVIRFNPELKSIFFMGPGIVAVILTIMTGFFAVVSVVREREQQTMDLLLSSRLGPLRIYIGKVIPPAMIGMVEMVMGILLVALWFNVPVRGGYMDLMITSLIFLPAIVSYSLLISIFSSTQQQAMFFGWFSMVTFLLLSGFFTPLRNIPAGIRFLADINPLRYYIHIIREIFLKGNGIACFWEELLMMAVIALVISSISVYVFYRRYEIR